MSFGPDDPPPIVVGAGPAGIRAAEVLATAGLRPVLIDEARRGGGQIYRQPPGGFTRGHGQLYGFEAGRALAIHRTLDRLIAERAIEYRPETLAYDLAAGVLMTIAEGRTNALPFRQIILATGAMDRVVPFAGWTHPGVYSLGAAQIALKHQGCLIGRRVAFVGTGPLLYLVAHQYARAGAKVAVLLDSAPLGAGVRALPDLLSGGMTFAKGLLYLAHLRLNGAAIRNGARPVAVSGDGARIDALAWRDARGIERVTPCDAVATGYGLKPETQLADLAGVPFDYDAAQRQHLPRHEMSGRTAVAGVYLAGDGAAIRGAVAAELQGRRAAMALLEDRGHFTPPWDIRPIERRLVRLARFRAGLDRAFPHPDGLAASIPDDTIVCRCESVRAGAVRRAAGQLDATEVNRAKAFVRVGMGRCQGRVCGLAMAELVAASRNAPLASAGRLRGQAPVKPVPLAARPADDGGAA
jgi:NADPH-dependent 2,4-dienoyl-CoA reductase/sulfur reductase-like enzyme